jgi:hypothetical protein
MYCTGVTFGEEIEHAPIEVLDQYEVAENVPIAYRVSFSAEMVRILKNPIKNRDGVTIMPTLENILSAPEMSGQIEDKNGTIVANIQRVKCAGYDSQIPARGVVMANVRFVAIRIKDESELT